MKKETILLLMYLLLFACNHQTPDRQKADKFYTEKSDYNLVRFPLIKPYQMAMITNGIPSDNWIMLSIDECEAFPTIPGVKHINVIDTVIFAYANNTIVNFQSAKKGWFILIPKRHIIREFTTQKEYLNYLSSIKVHDPKMYLVGEVFQYFDKEDTLDWQKLNKSY